MGFLPALKPAERGVYLDTSVVSYLNQEDTPERMQETLQLWELFKQGQYEVYISDIKSNHYIGRL